MDIDRPLDLLQRKGRDNYSRGCPTERKGTEITLAWVRVWSARKESLMERTTSSGVDGRSRDAMRKKKDISALAVPSPCRRDELPAGRRRTADGTGRNNAHWRQCMVGPGGCDYDALSSVSSALHLAAHSFFFLHLNPSLPVTILLFTPDYSYRRFVNYFE